MSKNIFVYGTLQNREVVAALTGKSFLKVPCGLDGYEVLKVKEEHYPGMITSSGKHIGGYVLMDVDNDSFGRIDKWEGKNYTRANVNIEVNGRQIDAVAYIWIKQDQLSGQWSNDEYRETHMKDCITKCIPAELETPDQ